MITRKDDQTTSIREHMRDGSGSAKLTALFNELPANARLFSTITLEPGSSIGYHVHENETEMFYFVSGFARVRDDDEFYEMLPGDAMATFSGHGHAVESIGPGPLVLVACIIKD